MRARAQRPAPAIVHRVLASPGKPLDPRSRTIAAQRLGHDFGDVRVHADALAADSARAVNAQAYTVANHVVLGTAPGERLLLHELTHVVQQRGRRLTAPLAVRPADDLHEREAAAGAQPKAGSAPVSVQRELPPADSTCKICSRPLQGVAGYVAGHAYVEAPGYRYAIIHPFCPKSPDDGVRTGTTAKKWSDSPDPCGQTPTCVECRPKAGVTDVAACLREQYDAYNSPNLYKALGPNSNTFVGTLSRACCEGMETRPDPLGTCPGWDMSPAPKRESAAECPPGPTCG